jgi:hypothetical protein
MKGQERYLCGSVRHIQLSGHDVIIAIARVSIVLFSSVSSHEKQRRGETDPLTDVDYTLILVDVILDERLVCSLAIYFHSIQFSNEWRDEKKSVSQSVDQLMERVGRWVVYRNQPHVLLFFPHGPSLY